MFLLATNEIFYETLRVAISTIQKLFGNSFYKIIVYDLGGISTNSTRVKFYNIYFFLTKSFYFIFHFFYFYKLC